LSDLIIFIFNKRNNASRYFFLIHKRVNRYFKLIKDKYVFSHSDQPLTLLPTWLPESVGLRQAPKKLHAWLSDKGSLTKKLSGVYDAELTIHVLAQHWGKPDSTELAALNMSTEEQRYVIRRVRLSLKGIARVYARSIFPEDCLSLSDHQHIHQLGKTPLGNWLFTHPELIRQPFEITCIQGKQIESDSGARPNQILWGRRSTFLLNNQPPMLVTEYFLTELPEVTPKSHRHSITTILAK